MAESDRQNLAASAALFGASPGTGNLGVDALCCSVADGLSRRGLRGPLAIADFASGVRPGVLELPGGAVRVVRFGATPTKRLYRSESFTRIRFLMGAGLALGGIPGLLKRCRVFLDISGGDSFTDLYGPPRFRQVCNPKELALRSGKRLILLPQTYGPFRDSGNRATAAELVRGAARCWARDGRSFEILKELLGDRFDASRHRLGVDVAFLLPRGDAGQLAGTGNGPEAGINVSGLIWNDPESARKRYGFRADYREAITTIVARVAALSRVVLVPHVLAARGHYESDRAACEDLVERLPAGVRGAVRVSADPRDACEVKGLIAGCSWFLGTRMHATIAGLSSGVPTAAIAYSDKTLGVFETCGQGEHVHDPRAMETGELVTRVMASFERREEAGRSLAGRLPGVLARASEQMDEVGAAVREAVGGAIGVGTG